MLRKARFERHTVPAASLIGLRAVWRGGTRVQVSEPARTLIDMLGAPALAGGVRHLVEMLDSLLRDQPKDASKLGTCASKLGIGSVFKRLGFLPQRSHPDQGALIELCRQNLSADYARAGPSIVGRSAGDGLVRMGADHWASRGTTVIPKPEIMAIAAVRHRQAHVVEKDYALGWFLAAISVHPRIGPRGVFKGGTCPKKCDFETCRCIEDLDITLQDAEHLDEAFLADSFEEIGEWVYDACGLPLPPEARKFEVFANKRGTRSGQGRVGYRDPLGRAGDRPASSSAWLPTKCGCWYRCSGPSITLQRPAGRSHPRSQ